jgi:ACT domain-containing protein
MFVKVRAATFCAAVALPRVGGYRFGRTRATESITMPNASKEAAPAQTGRAIITIIGSDRVGIIAGIANVLADANVNILDISQSVIREFFTMIMMVDLAGAAISFHTLSDRLAQKGQELSVRVEIQREEIFKAMHRV